MIDQKLLLVLPVPFRIKDNQLLFELQACNGLERWADNFGSVVIAAPIIPETLAEQEEMLVWRDTLTLEKPERFEFIPLPWAYSLPKFLICYPSVRNQLREKIIECYYLCFSIGYLWGDWAAIAALEARKLGKDYAILTDRVEYQVLRTISRETSLPKRIKSEIIAYLMEKYHKFIIKNCSLGLWHGKDCYMENISLCKNSHLIHDIHLKVSDQIDPTALEKKLELIKTETILQICYAGRLEKMKAPLDWVKALGKARELGTNFQAAWFGDGSLFEETKNLIAQLNLDDCIKLVGFMRNRQDLFQQIKDSHLMLFTHITRESPRCLLESFICGTPIVGYQSFYVDDLVEEYGGGYFVDCHNWQALGEILFNLFQNREKLIELTKKAAQNGKRFNDESVFYERSQLIKQTWFKN